MAVRRERIAFDFLSIFPRPLRLVLRLFRERLGLAFQLAMDYFIISSTVFRRAADSGLLTLCLMMMSVGRTSFP